jgi:hypothetical protein
MYAKHSVIKPTKISRASEKKIHNINQLGFKVSGAVFQGSFFKEREQSSS